MLKIKPDLRAIQRLFYLFLLGAATLVAAPAILFKYLFFGKYRGILLKRLGLSFDIPNVLDSKPVFWVHGVSLGEIRAASCFVDALQKDHPDHQIILSALTGTGYQAATKISGVIPYLLPSDLWTSFVMKRIDPKCLFLIEGDIWPNMVMSARRVLVVNGKISKNTFFWLKWFPIAKRYLVNPIHFWAVQSEIYRDRLLKLGVFEEKVVVTGDIKGAMRPNPTLPFSKKGLLLASTHHGEEELLLRALLPFDQMILLAPRHPERFDEVEQLLRKMGLLFTRSSDPKNIDHVQVLLIDEMGVLPKYYSSADCTIVGGSFIPKVGGHNLLEPILYGSVPLFGPWTEKQEHQKSLLQEHGVGFCLKIDEIKEGVVEILYEQDRLQNQKEKMVEIHAHMQRPLQATLECLVL